MYDDFATFYPYCLYRTRWALEYIRFGIDGTIMFGGPRPEDRTNRQTNNRQGRSSERDTTWIIVYFVLRGLVFPTFNSTSFDQSMQ